jgi:TolB protein
LGNVKRYRLLRFPNRVPSGTNSFPGRRRADLGSSGKGEIDMHTQQDPRQVHQVQALLRASSLAAGLLLMLLTVASTARPADQPSGTSPDLLTELKSYRNKLVYETNRDGNWELYVVNADGSNPVNITNTPDVDELFPRPSPDGTKIAFVADEGKGPAKRRNIYYMNTDGTGRTKVADNAREQCWSPDGSAIAYMKGEYEKFTYSDFATKGLYIYDLKTGKTRQHVNSKLHHLYTLNWSPDGNWFIATVHGGMGFRHGILAIEANGDKVYDLKLEGCRPNIRFDGKKITWGHGDYCAGVADLDLASPTPKATNIHNVVESQDPIETYHVVWSPDGKYLVYTRGPKFMGKRLGGLLPEFPGVEAPGWNICVADAAQRNRWVAITHDGKSCKQPGWVVVREEAGK